MTVTQPDWTLDGKIPLVWVIDDCNQTFAQAANAGAPILPVYCLSEGLNRHRLASPVRTSSLRIELEHPGGGIPAALFGVRCYGP